MGGMGLVMVVEVDPPADPGPGVAPAREGVQVDALVFEGPPRPLDKDIAEEPPLALHGDADAASVLCCTAIWVPGTKMAWNPVISVPMWYLSSL